MRRFSYTYLVTTYSQSVVSPWYRPLTISLCDRNPFLKLYESSCMMLELSLASHGVCLMLVCFEVYEPPWCTAFRGSTPFCVVGSESRIGVGGEADIEAVFGWTIE